MNSFASVTAQRPIKKYAIMFRLRSTFDEVFTFISKNYRRNSYRRLSGAEIFSWKSWMVAERQSKRPSRRILDTFFRKKSIRIKPSPVKEHPPYFSFSKITLPISFFTGSRLLRYNQIAVRSSSVMRENGPQSIGE